MKVFWSGQLPLWGLLTGALLSSYPDVAAGVKVFDIEMLKKLYGLGDTTTTTTAAPATESGKKLPPTKTVKYCSQTIAAEYFTPTSKLTSYYTALERFFDVSVGILGFARGLCTVESLPALGKSEIVSLRNRLPRGSSVSTQFPLDYLLSELRSQLGARQIDVTVETEAMFLMNMLITAIDTEVENLLRVELDSPDAFYRWVQFRGVESRLNPLRKMRTAASRATAECKWHLISSLQQLEGSIKSALSLSQQMMKELSRRPKDYGAPEGWSPYQEEGADWEGDTRLPGHIMAEHLKIANTEAQEAAKAFAQKRRDAIIKYESGKVADGEKAPFPEVKTSPLRQQLSLDVPFSHRLMMAFKVKDKGQVLDSITVKSNERSIVGAFPGIVGGFPAGATFWQRRLGAVDNAVTEYFKHLLPMLFPLLSDEIQLEAQQRPVELAGELKSRFICSLTKGVPAIKEVFLLTMEGTTVSEPFVLQRNSDFDSAPLKTKIHDLDLVLTESARLRGVKPIWTPLNGGGCLLGDALRNFDLELNDEGHEVCLQYGQEFDFDDDSLVAWPVCLGLFPPRSVLYGRKWLTDAKQNGEAEYKIYKERLAAKKAAIAAAEADLDQRKERMKAEKQNELLEELRVKNVELINNMLNEKSAIKTAKPSLRNRRRNKKAAPVSFVGLPKSGKIIKAAANEPLSGLHDSVQSVAPVGVAGRKPAAVYGLQGVVLLEMPNAISDLVDSQVIRRNKRRRAKRKAARRRGPRRKDLKSDAVDPSPITADQLLEAYKNQIGGAKTFELDKDKLYEEVNAAKQLYEDHLNARYKALEKSSYAAFYCSFPSRTKDASWQESFSHANSYHACFTDRKGSPFPLKRQAFVGDF